MSVPKKMMGVFKTAPGYDKMKFYELDVPEITDDKVLIKVAYTGICGSDIHTFKGEYINPTEPVVLGHEFAGEVVAIGDNVTKVKIGDRVTSETTFETSADIYTHERLYNLAMKRKGIGSQQNGSMANYVMSREESIHILPDTLSYEGAAMTEPLACCVHAMYQKSQLSLHDKIIIMGPGPIGLLLLQIAKHIGAFVIMTGITQDSERLEFARKLGADVVVDTLTEDLEAIVMKHTDGYGVDKAYDASGAVLAVNQVLKLMKKRARFVQVGLFSKQNNEIDTNSIIQREIEYIGSRSQNPFDWEIALHLLNNGAIDIKKMITKKFPLEDWRQAFEAVMAGKEYKVLIESNPGEF